MTHTDIITKPGVKQGFAFLGFGCMRFPSSVKEVIKMTDAYLETGLNYFDTAYIYGGSEDALRKALVTRHPRESYMIADKVPPWKVRNQKDCDKTLNSIFDRLKVDYLDFLLIHSIDEDNARSADKADMYNWAADQKKKGYVKHIGFSFHGTTELLNSLLCEHPEMEFVQLQLNYMDMLRGHAKQWQETALKHDKPVIAMEPVRGGALAKLPPAAEALMKAHSQNDSIASWAMRYAATIPGVACVLSGMSTLAQMKDNIKTFSPLKPLSDQEIDIIEAALVETGKASPIACTGCKYCLADCPQQIEIAHCFALYNEVKRGSQKWNLQQTYDATPAGHFASDCIACGKCVKRCPQHIDIPEELKKVEKMFN